MTARLKSASPDFEQAFAALLSGKRESAQDVTDAVAAILARVREGGDAALLDYTNTFDRMTLT
ncbi:MAG: histidinol dehydrogenase, partial [Exilibacterium sp.]